MRLVGAGETLRISWPLVRSSPKRTKLPGPQKKIDREDFPENATPTLPANERGAASAGGVRPMGTDSRFCGVKTEKASCFSWDKYRCSALAYASRTSPMGRPRFDEIPLRPGGSFKLARGADGASSPRGHL